jgi:hypothetical protein
MYFVLFILILNVCFYLLINVRTDMHLVFCLVFLIFILGFSICGVQNGFSGIAMQFVTLLIWEYMFDL